MSRPADATDRHGLDFNAGPAVASIGCGIGGHALLAFPIVGEISRDRIAGIDPW